MHAFNLPVGCLVDATLSKNYSDSGLTSCEQWMEVWVDRYQRADEWELDHFSFCTQIVKSALL